MNTILFDSARKMRVGIPEAVFCEGKPAHVVETLIREHDGKPGTPILFTRLVPEVFASFPENVRSMVDYEPLSRTAFGGRLVSKSSGTVAVLSAGTADGFVTWEVARTLEYLGIRSTVFEDCGVAGLWRLTSRIEEINAHDVVVVIAGLDAALASVVGGLTPKPVVAVPSSVGYGIARKGETALQSMLASCAPGVCVMNIDNGYGAACAAARVVNLLAGKGISVSGD